LSSELFDNLSLVEIGSFRLIKKHCFLSLFDEYHFKVAEPLFHKLQVGKMAQTLFDCLHPLISVGIYRMSLRIDDGAELYDELLESTKI
jgi:hypothetical protein